MHKTAYSASTNRQSTTFSSFRAAYRRTTQISKTDPHEDNHNIRLAQLLQEKGLGTSSLHKFPNGKFGDVYVELDHKRISPEAKVCNPDLKGNDALSDAAGRLAEDLADAALAVCYPHSPDQSAQLTPNSKIWISPIGGSWHETDTEGNTRRACFSSEKSYFFFLLDRLSFFCLFDIGSFGEYPGLSTLDQPSRSRC